jgi:hypothetical protein
MFFRIDSDHLVWNFPWSKDSDPSMGIVGKSGEAQWLDTKGLRGQLKQSPDGWLVMNHVDGLTLIDPRDWSQTNLERKNTHSRESLWSLSFLSALVDVTQGCFLPLDIDYSALRPSDPGYSGPVEATLLPGRNEIAINMTRDDHIVIFNFATGAMEFVYLPMQKHNGSGDGQIARGEFWMTCYDCLCSMDVETRAFRTSPVLQPPIRSKYGVAHAFVGSPLYVERLQGWLVPRPYSGDVLLISAEDLTVTGAINVGGSPQHLGLFDDGTFVIFDHSFKREELLNPLRTAHLKDLSPVTSTVTNSTSS